jgi:hypothetical protein
MRSRHRHDEERHQAEQRAEDEQEKPTVLKIRGANQGIMKVLIRARSGLSGS